MRNAHPLETAKTVLVLGGYGFIGRYVVNELRLQGYNVIIGTRGKSRKRVDQLVEERWLKLQAMKSCDDWLPVLGGVDVVVNAVGILRERLGETYEQVHHLAVKHLADACAERGILLVHVSAMSIEKSRRSDFSGSKLRGEQALMASNADCRIVRASLVEGKGAYGWTWFKKVARWPVHFIPERNALISPVRVELLAQAIVALITRRELARRIYEVANGERYKLAEYLCELGGGSRRPRVTIPDWMARAVAYICDIVHFTPFSIGHYEILKHDNCPEKNDLYDLIGAASIKKTECLFLGDSVWI